MKYYYTFGSHSKFPFHGGWVEIEAPSRKLADAIFRTNYPDNEPGILNCAECYSEEQFSKTRFAQKGNLGSFCHRRITGDEVPVKEPGMVDAPDIPEFVGQCIDIFEDFLESKGVEIENPEKEESESPAVIYGADYGDLSDALKALFAAWGITEKGEAEC